MELHAEGGQIQEGQPFQGAVVEILMGGLNRSEVGSDPGREEEWGGPYGPYLIPSYFHSRSPGHHAIVYTLGVPYLRTPAYAISWLVCLYLLWQVLA